MTTEPHTPTAFATGQPGSAELAIDPALVEQILTRFLRTEIHRTDFRRAVVGVSGGIDSSVVVALAARALGPENVLAVTMPYKTSSAATRRDSQAMIDSLGVQSLDVPITDQIDAYFARQPAASQMRLANKCARERMTILYDQSAAFEGLVLGTSNKSELLLGYGTQFGDMASALNPIGDLVQNPTAASGGPLASSRRRFWRNRPAAIFGSAKPTKRNWASPMPRSIGCWCCWSIAAGKPINWCGPASPPNLSNTLPGACAAITTSVVCRSSPNSPSARSTATFAMREIGGLESARIAQPGSGFIAPGNILGSSDRNSGWLRGSNQLTLPLGQC